MNPLLQQKFYHYGERPLAGVRDTDWEKKPHLEGFKPPGIWVSPLGEYDWPWWSKAEDFRLEQLRWRTQIYINPFCEIFFLRTVEDMRWFNKRYGYPASWSVEVLKRSPEMFRGMRPKGMIDWGEVAKVYDGIVIAPYQWDLRLADDFFWYYPWDCSSGVFWRARAIAGLGVPEDLLPPDWSGEALRGGGSRPPLVMP